MSMTQAQLNQQQLVQQALRWRHLFAETSRQLVSGPIGNVPYAVNGRGSLAIPNGFLMTGLTAHVHLPVTLNLNAAAAPALSGVGISSVLEEVFLNYNGSESTIFSADGIFVEQREAMEFPFSESSTADSVPVPAGAGTNYTYDWYFDVPNTYSLMTLMGLLNMNSNDINASIGVRWGDIKNLFVLSAGQTATVNGGYVEFIVNRQTQPTNPQQNGLPDLSKTYVVSYQDFNLAASGWNRLDIKADHTITRLTINLLEGGTGNGSDVAAYDTTNALQLETVKFGWASLINKMDSVPYWYFQQEMAKNYGQAMQKWINKGTIVLDLDKTGGRDWIDAWNVTNLAVQLQLGAAPPAGSKARVYLEQIVNTSTVPIRQL